MTSNGKSGGIFWVFPGLLIGAAATYLLFQWGDVTPAATGPSQSVGDTQLLAQYAGEAGLFSSDEALQRTLRDAVAAHLEGSDAEPSEPELKTYYRQSGSRFRTPARFLVQRMIFRGVDALKFAEHAHSQLEGGAEFGSVKAQFASPDLLSLPAGYREAKELKEYLGEELAQVVSQMPRGAYTEPVAEAGGYVILGVLDNEPARKPPFVAVREQVVEDFIQHRRDEALETLLQELRAAANMQ